MVVIYEIVIHQDVAVVRLGFIKLSKLASCLSFLSTEVISMWYHFWFIDFRKYLVWGVGEKERERARGRSEMGMLSFQELILSIWHADPGVELGSLGLVASIFICCVLCLVCVLCLPSSHLEILIYLISVLDSYH